MVKNALLPVHGRMLHRRAPAPQVYEAVYSAQSDDRLLTLVLALAPMTLAFLYLMLTSLVLFL